MPKPITKELLERMMPHERMVICGHARERTSPEADDVKDGLFQYRLLDKAGGGLPRDDRVIQAVEAICRSADGVRAAVAAATRGEALMAGVDPLLRSGVREYGHFDTTSWAGGFVAEEIEALGWERSGRRTLPSNCVAKTAAFFVEPQEGSLN